MSEKVAERKSWVIDVRPLRVTAYRRMWVGNGLSFFGFQFTAVAVPVEMYAITHSSAWVGLLGIAGLIPLLIFGLWGGAAADVVDRRKLLLASSLLAWIATVGLLAQALFAVNSAWLLLALTAVQSAGFAISSPTRQAIIPRIVPTGLVPAANTLSYTTTTAGGVLGPLAAGLIFAVSGTGAGVTTAYLVDAMLFTISFWATWRLPPIPPIEHEPGEQRPTAGLKGIAVGLKFLVTQPVLLLSFAVDIVAMVFAMPRALFPEVAVDRFGGDWAVGWLFSAIAIGSVVGGLTSGWIGRIKRQGVALVLAVVAWGVAIGLSGLAHSLWLMVLLLAVGGAADLVSAVYRQSILQVYAPDRLRGRLQGVFTVVVAGGPRLGDLRAGATADLTSPAVSWAGGGFAAAGLAVVLAAAFPALLRYRPPAVQAAGTDDDANR
ncbi:MFS transporter [Paractinoplanes brasiliensis]|uniref:Putative MFS family arabinose efflux permease n=1 Tax=Paractinoplanes brasiliensis TaxID=52695 RepID=A0A4R6JWP8_9ACTN|nr:MFS transporter [Actinoplanes brasiliensis]TDO39115.1 putative MFS family arabinose efflux permease [Actinoplanes brasiliensis]GID30184.1 MFS transporter [Actinoplanes brasiliensis]